MKRILSLSAILFFALTMLTSCRQASGLDAIRTIMIDVPKSSWNYTNKADNNYFYATVKVPELSERAFDQGMVKVYRVYHWDRTDASQVPLPYTHMAEAQTESGDWVFYSEMVDYEFTIGGITIFFTASDFDYELDSKFVPDAMKFRCVVMY